MRVTRYLAILAAMLLAVPALLAGHFPFAGAASVRSAPLAQAQAGPLKLVKLIPGAVELGKPFNYQARAKESALAVLTENAPAGTVIVFNGHTLKTDHGSGGILTAGVPDSLVAKPGQYVVYLKYGSTQSNQLTFSVLRHLVLVRLIPPSIKLGQRFNYQQKARVSALAVIARNARPFTVIIFNGHVLPTSVDNGVLTAPVATNLVSGRGSYPVRLRYGTMFSNVVPFVVR